MTVVVVREQLRWLVCVQARKSPAEAGKGEKLGPLSRHGTRQLEEYITWGPFYPSFFFFLLLLSPSPLPVLWQSLGVFGREETPFPIPCLRALPCGLGLTGHFSLPGFHYASHDTSSSHDIERYKYGRFPKRSRKGRHSNSHSSGGCTPSLSPVAQKQGDHCLQTKEWNQGYKAASVMYTQLRVFYSR